MRRTVAIRRELPAGRKVLLFLYPPSKLGLTCPVGGASGRFAIDPGGRIIILPERTGVGLLRRPTRAEEVPRKMLLRPEDFARSTCRAREMI